MISEPASNVPGAPGMPLPRGSARGGPTSVRVFAVPTLLVLLLGMGVPVLFSLYLSVHEWRGASLANGEFVGLSNYVATFQNGRFWNALLNTLYFAGLALVVESVLGVAIGLLLGRAFRGRGLIRVLFLLPLLATPAAISLVWRLMYHPSLGIFSQMLRAIPGVEGQELITTPATVIPALVLVDAWQWTPFIILITITGVAALPRDPLEAALIDGASGWQRVRYVTLPMLKPVILAAVAFRGVDALRTFDVIFVVTSGGPARASETLNIYAYLEMFLYSRFGVASAVVMCLMTVTLLLAYVVTRARAGR